MSGEVRLAGIRKVFGSTVAVDRLDLEIEPGEFFALLGPSGCGKTTTLRVIAGLEEPTSGEVYIRDRLITGMPAHKRNVGMVFQDYALFPHMTVFDNIAFGLRMKRWPKSRIAPRVRELLELVRLPGYDDRYPAQLSGGEQQRVALARSLAPEPTVLLLDEPLSNLDLRLRQGLRLELKRIQRELEITTVFVTHDQGEAFSLSDRVMVMRKGRKVQIGTPSDIYQHPQDEWALSFLGDAAFFDGMVKVDETGGFYFATENGLEFSISDVCGTQDKIRRGKCTAAIRPETVSLFPMDAAIDTREYSVYVGCVDNFAYVGSSTRYVMRLDEPASANVLVMVDVAESAVPSEVGTKFQVAFPRDKWILLDKQGD